MQPAYLRIDRAASRSQQKLVFLGPDDRIDMERRPAIPFVGIFFIVALYSIVDVEPFSHKVMAVLGAIGSGFLHPRLQRELRYSRSPAGSSTKIHTSIHAYEINLLQFPNQLLLNVRTEAKGEGSRATYGTPRAGRIERQFVEAIESTTQPS